MRIYTSTYSIYALRAEIGERIFAGEAGQIGGQTLESYSFAKYSERGERSGDHPFGNTIRTRNQRTRAQRKESGKFIASSRRNSIASPSPGLALGRRGFELNVILKMRRGISNVIKHNIL